jgi:hypothetical protein
MSMQEHRWWTQRIRRRSTRDWTPVALPYTCCVAGVLPVIKGQTVPYARQRGDELNCVCRTFPAVYELGVTVEDLSETLHLLAARSDSRACIIRPASRDSSLGSDTDNSWGVQVCIQMSQSRLSDSGGDLCRFNTLRQHQRAAGTDSYFWTGPFTAMLRVWAL